MGWILEGWAASPAHRSPTGRSLRDGDRPSGQQLPPAGYERGLERFVEMNALGGEEGEDVLLADCLRRERRIVLGEHQAGGSGPFPPVPGVVKQMHPEAHP